MFPLWEVAVAPILEAAGARRMVEIGALRGENTRQMIERLGPETELHVIDPVPDFDPDEHVREFGGQYVFHRDLSLNVLGGLPPMDAALIDGDHNWYTVYNELRLLRDVSRRHDAPLPVLLLHDVGWPYGRRDLYYDPSNIPDEFRRDWKRSGMEPGKVRLVPFGAGLNPTLANAKVEGGLRNGVMTGVDDFVAEHDRPLRVVVLPIYFGLAVVVEEERLVEQPALAAELDRLESPEGKDALLELAEEIRLRALIFQHRIYFDRERTVARLVGRYLAELKGRLSGEASTTELDALEACLGLVDDSLVLGDVTLVGLTEIAPAALIAAYLDSFESTRELWATGPDREASMLDSLREEFEEFGAIADRTHTVVVAPGETADKIPDRVSLLYVGGGAGVEAGSALRSLHARLSPGGIVYVADDVSDDVLALLEELRPVEPHVDDTVWYGRGWREPDGVAPTALAPPSPSDLRAQ